MIRSAITAGALALALIPAVAQAAPRNEFAGQEFYNLTTVVLACHHIKGGCKDTKLKNRTHPNHCTRDVWWLYLRYPQKGQVPVRILITKACFR